MPAQPSGLSLDAPFLYLRLRQGSTHLLASYWNLPYCLFIFFTSHLTMSYLRQGHSAFVSLALVPSIGPGTGDSVKQTKKPGWRCRTLSYRR